MTSLNLSMNLSFCGYLNLPKEELHENVNNFLEMYKADISSNNVDEIDYLQAIQAADFSGDLTFFQLLNTLTERKLNNIFPNIRIALRIFVPFLLP